MEYAAYLGWEGHPVKPQAVLDAGRVAVEKQHAATGLVSATQKWIGNTKEKAKESSQSVHNGAEKLKAVSDALKTEVVKNTGKAQSAVTEAKNDLKHESLVLSEDILKLTRRAEDVLTGSEVAPPQTVLESLSMPSQSTAVDVSATSHEPTYTDRLPIGFEVPPGFVLPSRNKPVADADAPVYPPPGTPAVLTPLPLITPAISELSSTEPVLAQVASTIDNLAAFLKDNQSAVTNSNAKGILDTAQTDLIQLGERLQKIKEDERARLQAELESQAQDYTLKLLQQEMEAQDKMDHQEEEWRNFSDKERQITVQLYRAKLEQELQTQIEIINQR